MLPDVRFTVSHVTKRAGISAFRLRWYEEAGLLGEVERTEGHQRVYTAEQVSTLERIAAWRRDSLTIGEIKVLLGIPGAGDRAAKLRERVVARLDDLGVQVRALRTLVEAGGSTTESAPEADARRERRYPPSAGLTG